MALRIFTANITLGDALKWAGITATGGEAKIWIRNAQVQVNGVIERRRGRRLGPGDRIAVAGREYRVVGR